MPRSIFNLIWNLSKSELEVLYMNERICEVFSVIEDTNEKTMGGLFSAYRRRGSNHGDGPDASHVQAFHSSDQWKLHLESLKGTSKLVQEGETP